MFRCGIMQTALQEIPGKIALTVPILGCPNGCEDCQWEEYNKAPENYGTEFKYEDFEKKIKLYAKHYSALVVLFYGGEWDMEVLNKYIDIPLKYNLDIAFYTGKELEDFSEEFLNKLTYIKVGKFDKDRGSLKSKTTNQKLYNLKTKENITYKFWKNEVEENANAY